MCYSYNADKKLRIATELKGFIAGKTARKHEKLLHLF